MASLARTYLAAGTRRSIRLQAVPSIRRLPAPTFRSSLPRGVRWASTEGSAPPPPNDSNTPRLAYGLGATLALFGGIYVILQVIPNAMGSRNINSAPSSSKPDVQGAIAALRKRFPEEQVSVEESVLHEHGYSAWSYHPPSPPAVVFYPTSTADCVDLMRIATKHRVPLYPYAGGTSLEAHWAPSQPGVGISVDFELMDNVLALNVEDGDVTVQPGVRYEDLNIQLKEMGHDLFFPVDPGPGAAFGGMLASGGSGTNAVRYGTMKGDYVLNVTVVLPSGEVIKTRSRARKSSAGPDLTKLFLGSEGTLGLIVEATLRLAPLLPSSVAVVPFSTVEEAVTASRKLLSRGVGVQCVELLDDKAMLAVNKANENDPDAIIHAERPSLFIRFAGSEAHRKEDERLIEETVREIAGEGTKIRFARKGQQVERLWRARKVALWSAMQYVGDDARCWTTDVCVPMGRLPQLVKLVKEDLDREGLFGPIVGHVGDGNFHSLIVFRDKDKDEVERVKKVVHRMVQHAQGLGGTASGEHGIGRGKREYLEAELGPGTVQLLRLLKRTIDPLNIMNPGAMLLPEEGEEVRGH